MKLGSAEKCIVDSGLDGLKQNMMAEELRA